MFSANTGVRSGQLRALGPASRLCPARVPRPLFGKQISPNVQVLWPAPFPHVERHKDRRFGGCPELGRTLAG
jgi:hypothetical protein